MARLDADYTAPRVLFNGHIQTIYPALFRSISGYCCSRYRIDTRDEDELVVDHHLGGGHRKAVILCHGLEGHSRKPYILGMARWYNAHGWDVFAWNYRGCAEGPNKKIRFYHSGATEDLEDVIIHVLKRHFTTLSLVGFSLGGNLVLKYLGENNHLPDAVRSAVVFSVPLDLHAGASNLHRAQNRMYELRFLRSLKRKVLLKHRVIPQLDIQPLGKVSTLVDFDDVYTAPMHGFDSAPDYYRKCSALYFLDGITTPTMLVNAQNDPFLTPECTPHDTLEKHQYIHLLTPRHGGHAGFTSFNRQKTYWSEMQALGFSEKHA